MMLRSQDVLVALKLGLHRDWPTYARLGHELGMSSSQAHAAVKRASDASLLNIRAKRVHVAALREFLIHGVKYAFPVKKGPVVRGLPTAHSAPPLRGVIDGRSDPVVWPDPNGEVRGESLDPLFKSAPMAARRDPKLYESLALIDAIRSGRARERSLASKKLEEMFSG